MESETAKWPLRARLAVWIVERALRPWLDMIPVDYDAADAEYDEEQARLSEVWDEGAAHGYEQGREDEAREHPSW